MKLFGKPKMDESEKAAKASQAVLDEQRRDSEATLELVTRVLKRKDELLAEAINQTGSAVRPRRRKVRT